MGGYAGRGDAELVDAGKSVSVLGDTGNMTYPGGCGPKQWNMIDDDDDRLQL
jgi:hypothetical protein